MMNLTCFDCNSFVNKSFCRNTRILWYHFVDFHKKTGDGSLLTYIGKNPFKTAFDSLEEFAELISEVLACPITIEDANHRLLAYSTHDERTDPARIATIIGRRVPEKVINSLWKEGIIPALLESDEAIRVKSLDGIGLGDRIAISIRNKGDVLGFIWALEVDKEFTDNDFLLLKEAATAVKSKLLQLQARKNKKEERSQEFFWKLLTGHMQRRDEITDHLQLLQIKQASSFVLAVFQFQHEITREEEKQMMYLLQTSQQVQVMLHTVDGERLVLLLSAVEHQEMSRFVEEFVCRLEKRFHISGIQPAFGNIYDNYAKIEKAYKEALNVLTIKKKFPIETAALHSYGDMGIYQLIDLLLENRKGTDHRNQALKKLHDYDQKHNSNLVETLDVFLNKDSNVNDAAKALTVHPNTLAYRLKRISEIGGIHFKDPNQKLMLYLDLKLEKFL